MRALFAATGLVTAALTLTGCSGSTTAAEPPAPSAPATPAAAKADEAVFEVTGSGSAKVSYRDKAQGKHEEKVQLPWSKSFPITSRDYLFVTVSGTPGEAVACRATVGGKEVSKKSAEKGSLPVIQCTATTP
ncbi:MmpS family transport accessory protein [Allokutzneria sp. A3M-2-11 16]|uniref:MmpS family transport accessory protein n=1 Tax=Allokutzneria sp. A3M-2-11 16 TaxID=2962043 RepID=UPI0020B73D37|nr:MmpS family transport accessory protein [Allokutzneria sp. A3M-2-11 16]MCP3797640.1 MmpS family transport accessory protein [Allokutzneria sp. A3M-2-11 16]